MLTQPMKKESHYRLTLILCIVLSLLAVVLLVSLLWPRTSRDEAAAAWLRAAGGPETAQPLGEDDEAEAKSIATRVLDALDKRTSEPGFGNQVKMPLVGTRWRISYGETTTVEVDPQSKDVVYLLDRSALGAYTTAARSPSGLADAELIKRALESLARLGVTIEDGEVSRATMTPQGDTPLVLIRFPRVYGGYPFWDDAIAVMINRLDGSLYSYNKLYRGGSMSGSVRLSPEDAISKALAYLEASDKAKGFRPGATTSLVMFVRPNDYWTPRPLLEGGEPRLAYVVRVRNAEAGRPPVECIVWIDAEDGRALGGTRSQ